MQSFILGKNFQENSDPNFNKETKSPKIIKKNKEVKKNKPIVLTESQEIIFDYIKAHKDAGISLEKIIKTLEKSKTQGNYTSEDIAKANKKLEQEENTQSLNENEKVLLEYLKQNPNHKLATTQIYKEVGLSARKGTNTKKSLEEKGLIKIEEIKYEKGWKKMIRLA